MLGRTLSHYEVLEEISRGGMGIVYRALDLKLDREVALKVLPQALVADPERLRRFEQEARSASALNHPNIITIYEINNVDSTPYIAMELVEGKTLREMLSAGPLPTKKLLLLASQIAEGLAKAHSAGIVHRDLKPENIMITGDGFVKILDFGLAKLTADLPRRSRGEGGSNADSEMATMEKGGTTPGVVMGTAGYMSPEQAKGQAVDFRADQFAFGAILYEMVSGKRAFHRETGAETISAVLRDEPQPLADTHPNLSPHLRAIVERCLAKDAEDRYAATSDLAKDLKGISNSPAGTPRPRSRRMAIAGVLIGVLGLLVGLYMGGLLDRSPDSTSPRIESLVVLPLDNLSGDPDQEYFADGMTEVLTSDLAKISAIKVISRTSAMRYKGTDKPLPEIARELNVEGVVEGSVMRAGDRVRITAQLIEAGTDQHVWSESYERDLREVLTLQSEVARAIAQEIKVKLTAQEVTLLSRDRPVNSEAHEAYLRGRYHVEKASPEEVQKAIGYFQRAIEIDPSYAGGYSGLAFAYLYLAGWGYSPPGDAMAKAEEAALKAVELDDTDASARTTLGFVRWSALDWAAAEQEFRKAIELNPGDAEAHGSYGLYLKSIGQQDEGLAEAKRALELDPLSLRVSADLATHLIHLGRYDEAIEQSMKMLELAPDFHRPQTTLALAYRQKGMDKEAFEAGKKAVSVMFGDTRVAEAMDQGYAKSGLQGARLALAQELAERSKRKYVKPYFIAFYYALAERKEEALHWLERAYAERDIIMLGTLKIDTNWDFARSDPRFQDIMRRLNFPE